MEEINTLSGLDRESIERLKSLETEHGELTPDRVVEDAKHADSPLHKYFEWDNKTAGHKYRIIQARSIIQSVRVQWTTNSVSVRSVYYVRDPNKEPSEQGYVALPRLLDDKGMAHQAIGREIERIKSAIERARGPAKVLGLEPLLDSMLESFTQHEARFASAAD